MTYTALRALHVACAALSISLFLLRGGLALSGRDWRRWRPLRWLPHLNDSLLLGAAIGLCVWSGLYPVAQAWLSAKLLALMAYILLGRIALQQSGTGLRRSVSFAGALLCVAYIVGVAFTHSPTLGR